MRLALVWIAVAVATSVAGGYWAIGVGLLACAALILYLPWPRFSSANRGVSPLWAMALAAAGLSLRATLTGPLPMRTNAGWAEPWIAVAQILCLVLVGTYALQDRTRASLTGALLRWRFPALVGLATAAGAFAIAGVPDPRIDVFYFLNEGVAGLAHGSNPYAMQFTALPGALNVGYADPAYHFDVYSYLPGTLLLTAPALLSGDVRWVMLGAVFCSAIMLKLLGTRLGVKDDQAELMGATFMCYPGLLYVLQQAWVEPLIVTTWVAALTLQLARPARGRLAALCAGLSLSVKQYAPPLLLPLLYSGMTWRQLIIALALPATLSVPFVLWGPADFYWDAFWYQIQAPMRADALSLNGYLMNEWGASLPGWVTLAAPAFAAVYAALAWLRRDSLAVVLTRTAGLYLVLFLFNKFAFANYYFLLQAILIVGVGAWCAPAAATQRVILKNTSIPVPVLVGATH